MFQPAMLFSVDSGYLRVYSIRCVYFCGWVLFLTIFLNIDLSLSLLFFVFLPVRHKENMVLVTFFFLVLWAHYKVMY